MESLRDESRRHSPTDIHNLTQGLLLPLVRAELPEQEADPAPSVYAFRKGVYGVVQVPRNGTDLDDPFHSLAQQFDQSCSPVPNPSLHS